MRSAIFCLACRLTTSVWCARAAASGRRLPRSKEHVPRTDFKFGWARVCAWRRLLRAPGIQERTGIATSFCIENKKLGVLGFAVTHVVTRGVVGWPVDSRGDRGAARIISSSMHYVSQAVSRTSTKSKMTGAHSMSNWNGTQLLGVIFECRRSEGSFSWNWRSILLGILQNLATVGAALLCE